MALQKPIKNKAGVLKQFEASDIIDIGFLGTGTPDGTKFLRDDNTLAVPPGASSLNLSYNSGTHGIDISGGGTSAVIPLSVADGATLGLAAFLAADFNAASGVISIDYTNGQAASAGAKGFLTAADWSTFNSKGSGDILNNGNTGAVIIGTNDATTLSFETNNVVRATVTGAASTGGAWTFTQVTANTATVADILTLQTNSTGTAAASFGSGILFQGESSTTDNRDMVRLVSRWVVATDASRTAGFDIEYVNNAGALTRIGRFQANAAGAIPQFNIGAGNTSYFDGSINTGTSFTVGNSSSALILGGSSGTVSLTSSASSTGAILIQCSNTTTGGVTVGNTAHTGATLAKSLFKFSDTYTVASGTGTYSAIEIANTFNLTSTASGIQRGIYINPTLTSLTAAEYRGIDIAYSNASAKGIYQSGALTTNNFAGPTNIGSTNAPVALVPLTVEYASANTATVQDMIVIRTNSTGTAATSFGAGILFQGESSTTDNRDMARIRTYWTTATDASRASAISFDLVSATTTAEKFKFYGDGSGLNIYNVSAASPATYANNAITTATSFTVGNSSSALTVGGSSGAVTVSTSSGTASGNTGPIDITASLNGASSTAFISFGGSTSFTQTSGTRNYVDMGFGFAPISGTAVHNQLVFNGTFNQTGGANGITRNIYLNPTLTAVADFRGIESTFNTANAWHIYQTGSSAKGNTLVKTSIGTTTAPTALLLLAAGTTGANTAPIQLTTGTSETVTRAGLIQYTTPKLTFTNGGLVEQEIPQIQQSRVTAQFDKTDATLANITGLTSTLVAGKIYRFEAKLFYDADVVGGSKFAIAGTATATAIIYHIRQISDATNAFTITSRKTALAGSSGQAGSVAGYTLIEGLITCNAAGTLVPQFSQNAVNGTSSIIIGSTFETKEII